MPTLFYTFSILLKLLSEIKNHGLSLRLHSWQEKTKKRMMGLSKAKDHINVMIDRATPDINLYHPPNSKSWPRGHRYSLSSNMNIDVKNLKSGLYKAHDHDKILIKMQNAPKNHIKSPITPIDHIHVDILYIQMNTDNWKTGIIGLLNGQWLYPTYDEYVNNYVRCVNFLSETHYWLIRH